MENNDKIEKIKQLNDNFRRYGIGNGKILITSGVAALPYEDIFNVQQEVRQYEDFSPANDPYGEHDFGSFKYHKQKYFFKIDYFDMSGEFASPDPANPNLTLRVLTIMLSDEY